MSTEAPTLDIVREEIEKDDQSQTGTLAELVALDILTQEDVVLLRVKHLRHICDRILLKYLDEQRLESYPEMRELDLPSLFARVREQVGFLLGELKCLGSYKLPDDHLLVIAERCSVIENIVERSRLQDAHPDLHTRTIHQILPINNIENVLKAVERQAAIIEGRLTSKSREESSEA